MNPDLRAELADNLEKNQRYREELFSLLNSLVKDEIKIMVAIYKYQLKLAKRRLVN